MSGSIPAEARDYISKNFTKGRLVCFCGAGISCASGIPTFRGKGGLWERYDPGIYADSRGLTALFKERPAKAINFIVDLYDTLLKASPNPAHKALAVLEKARLVKAVITQNVDDLQRQAGSRNIIELHGNAFRTRCMRCSESAVLHKNRIKEMAEALKESRDSRMKMLRVLSRYFPRCRRCRGRHRIDIVLFGEVLPPEEIKRAYKELDNCNVLLLIGTSLVVHPAAGLPLYAKEKGARLIEINSEPSALSDLCDYKIRGEAAEVLPEIVRLLGYA